MQARDTHAAIGNRNDAAKRAIVSGDGAAFERRRELAPTFPQLDGPLAQHVTAAEQLIESILMERLETGGQDAVLYGLSDARDSAGALLMLAYTVMRLTYVRDPGDHAESSSAADEASEIFGINEDP